jgi:guanosine-3',5'-bis(diphosphate) 3'-pyrophosphohydrolase
MPDSITGLPKTQAAIAYATRAHDGQRRKADGAPFIEHPLEVGGLLLRAGAPDHVIAAGVLHDTIEKTDADRSELRRRFGAQVAMLVAAVSEDADERSYARRKAALRDQAARAGDEALMVLAADKVSKARELTQHPSAARRSRARRLTHYSDCLRLLEQRIPDSPLVRQLDTELGSLARAAARERAHTGAHTARS